MKYCVYIGYPGSKLHNDDLGDLPHGIAIPITDNQVLIAKHLNGVVVFDKVAGVDEAKVFKKAHGIRLQLAEKNEEEILTYQEFVSKKSKEGKMLTDIKPLWENYKKERNLT